MKRVTILVMTALIVCSVAVSVTASNWPHDPKANLPVGTSPGSEGYTVITADGSGGAIIAWVVDTGFAYAQHVDRWGNIMWPGPVLLCSAPGYRYMRDIVTDGAGGAIVVWDDLRTAIPNGSDTYAQRVSGEGATLWPVDGVRVCVNDSIQHDATMVPDLEGGAYIAWVDYRYGIGDSDIMAQRIDGAGTYLWNPGGTVACASLGNQSMATITVTTDSALVVVWEDERTDPSGDIYGNKLDPFGTQVWTLHGEPLATQPGISEVWPGVAPDDWGGAYFVWRNWAPTPDGVYGQRVNSSGTSLWTAGGIRLTTTLHSAAFPGIVSDGQGGAIISFWTDPSIGTSIDVGLQRIDPNGARLWGDDVAVVTQPASQTTYEVESDGAGGAVVVWRDDRYSTDSDIYAQRVDTFGNMLWTPNGVAVCTEQSYQYGSVTCSDGAGGLITAWTDLRDPWADIYAQRVERHGYLGYPSPDIVEVVDTPGDQGGYATVAWFASYLDAYPYDGVTEYTVWRWAAPPGSAPEKARVGDTGVRRAMAAGVDRELAESQAALGWEYIGTTPAAAQDVYALAVPTFGDSTGGGVPEVLVKVIAHGGYPGWLWESEVAAGYSVDNLAPAAPLNLVAQRVGIKVRLDWNPSEEAAPDFDFYAVYRANSSGVTSEPIYFIDASADTTLWDNGATPGTPYYYIVTAVDRHQNQSDPSNEAMVDGSASGAGDRTPKITELLVADNAPNPFGVTTELRIGLPAAGEVTVDVYDVAGRRVARLAETLQEGWQTIRFDGRASGGAILPSGVYFYRVRAAGSTVTKKMVIYR